MRKAIVTADLHIDINNRFEDTKAVLKQLATYAVKNKIDDIMILGDIYERRRPYNSEKAVFEKFVKYLADEGLFVHILAGNHDMDKDLVSAVEEFKILDLDGIYLYENPTIIDFEGHKVFLGHFLVSGAKLGPSDYQAQTPTTVKSILKEYEAELYLLGDVHKAQRLHKDPDILYVGSPERVDFGERLEKKGFVLLEENEGILTYKSVELKTRPMVQYNIKNIKSWLKSDIDQRYKDAIVKLKITCNKEDFNTLKEVEIRNKVKDAKHIKIEYDIIKEDRVRNENISEEKTPLETFIEYSKEKELDKQTVDLGLEIIRGLK